MQTPQLALRTVVCGAALLLAIQVPAIFAADGQSLEVSEHTATLVEEQRQAAAMEVRLQRHGEEAVPQKPSASNTVASAAAIRRWIEELDADRFMTRESATRRLIDAGPLVIEAVTASAGGRSLEVTSRSVRVLNELCLSADADTEEAAGAALERLVDSGSAAAAQQALAALQSQGATKRDRAVNRIRALGGVVEGYDSFDGETMIYSVVLGKSWRGGEAGLSHLRWLASVQRLSLYGGEFTDQSVPRLKNLTQLSDLLLYGTQVTDAGEQVLQEALPQAQIDRRDGALLGVSGSMFAPGQGCQIVTVQPGSAAERAGLRSGDIINKFDDQPILDFSTLTTLIARKKPGAKVTLEIQRESRKFAKEVVLGEWQ